jgi:hypothetical protein
MYSAKRFTAVTFSDMKFVRADVVFRPGA